MNKSKGGNKRNPSDWKARGFKSTIVISTSSEKYGALPFATGSNSLPVNRALSQKRKFKTSVPTQPNENDVPDVKEVPVAQETPAPNPTPPLKIKKNKKKLVKNPVIGKSQTEGAVEGAAEGKKKPPKRQKQKFKSYTLFIGNLSYETTKEDIENHFAKCGKIKNVRLPVGKEDNSPRGFAYIEVEDNVTYENLLSLHHTFLKRRRINVECTFGGSGTSQKRKSLIKEKTLRLRFLSREGKISSAKMKPWGKPKTSETTTKSSETTT